MLWIIAIVALFMLIGATAQLRGIDSTDRLSSSEADLAARSVIWER
jgi:hypothetical protein